MQVGANSVCPICRGRQSGRWQCRWWSLGECVAVATAFVCVLLPVCAAHIILEQLNPIYYYYCAHRRPIALFTRSLACSLSRAGPITIFSGRMLMQKGTLSTGTQRVKRGPARWPPPPPPLVLSILARCLPQNSFFVTCRENWRAQSCFVRPSAFLLFY
jgi:hypothetical protein